MPEVQRASDTCYRAAETLDVTERDRQLAEPLVVRIDRLDAGDVQQRVYSSVEAGPIDRTKRSRLARSVPPDRIAGRAATARRRRAPWPSAFRDLRNSLAERCPWPACGSCSRRAGRDSLAHPSRRSSVLTQPLMNASRSGLTTSACVVHMPCGNFS